MRNESVRTLKILKKTASCTAFTEKYLFRAKFYMLTTRVFRRRRRHAAKSPPRERIAEAGPKDALSRKPDCGTVGAATGPRESAAAGTNRGDRTEENAFRKFPPRKPECGNRSRPRNPVFPPGNRSRGIGVPENRRPGKFRPPPFPIERRGSGMAVPAPAEHS